MSRLGRSYTRLGLIRPGISLLQSDNSVSDSDTGTGAETQSLAVTLSGNDTSSSTETSSAGTNITGSDTGSGTETQSNNNAIPGNDTGSGTESQSIAVTLTNSDTGLGSDTESLDQGSVGVSLTQSHSSLGRGRVATRLGLTRSIVYLDTGSGSANKNDTDTSTATETESIAVTLSDSDTSTGTDVTVNVDQGTTTVLNSQIHISTVGRGGRQGTHFGRSIVYLQTADANVKNDTDTGTGTDTESISVTLSSTDTGTGTESQNVNGGSSTPSDSDTSTTSESQSIAVTLSSTDTGQGTETQTLGTGANFPITVFTSGTTTSNGSGAYTKTRIPAIVQSKGVLVAFCEGRRIDNDYGDIEIIASRSLSNGTTWTGTDCIRVVDNGSYTAGNPAPVVNSAGDIVLLFVKENRDVTVPGYALKRFIWKTVSSDAGATWSTPVDLTSSLNLNSAWTWIATGPCHGIIKKYGVHKGRLIVPYNANSATSYVAGFLYSDDDGATWVRGGTRTETSASGNLLNEASVAELNDGSLVLVIRNQTAGTGKLLCTSTDGGETISATSDANITTAEKVQGSLLMADKHPSQLLYEATPAALSGTNRVDLTINVSSNGGASWSTHRYINSNAAYSDMFMLDGGNHIGILYEQGVSPQYQKIQFESIPITSITQVGSHTTANTGGTDQTSLAVNKPSGVVAGHLLLAAIVSNNADATPPSGWTEFQDSGSTLRNQLYWKIATSSEPSSYTWTFSGARPILGSITAWDNVDINNPIAGLATADVVGAGVTEPYATPTVSNNDAIHGRTVYLRSTYRSGSSAAITFTTAVVNTTEVADDNVPAGSTNRAIGWYVDTYDFTGNLASKTGLATTASATEADNTLNTWTLRAEDPLLGEDSSNTPVESQTISISSSDTCHGIDTEFVDTSGTTFPVSSTDTVSGTDTQSIAFSQTETCTSTETVTIAVSSADTCSSTESQNSSGTQTDTVTATETQSITVQISSTDSCSGVDSGGFFTPISSSDTCTSTESVYIPAPTHLTCTPISTTQINISWDQIVGALAYDLERNSVIIATNLSGTTYNDTGLQPSTSYTYRVRSVRT